MSIAFYAPLKAPTHPVPSGDRAMAQALMAALDHAGYRVTLASELRLYDGTGDSALQTQLARAAAQEVARLTSAPEAGTWTHWLSYHNYYKAPDLIGPAVSAALKIPYLQIESTRARKRLSGPWAGFAANAEAASDAAGTILYFTQRDAETLRRDAPDGQRLVHLPPFLNRTDLPAASDHSGPLLSVAMMRHGDKLASYGLIADALGLLPEALDWCIDIVGDGAARGEVAALMEPFGARVKLHGAGDPAPFYAHARALLWPGVNEAFGMVYLEAQASGVPVIAQDRPGVRDVLAGAHPSPEAGPQAVADRIATLWTTPDRTHARTAREMIASTHLLPHAAQVLGQALENAR